MKALEQKQIDRKMESMMSHEQKLEIIKKAREKLNGKNVEKKY